MYHLKHQSINYNFIVMSQRRLKLETKLQRYAITKIITKYSMKMNENAP